MAISVFDRHFKIPRMRFYAGLFVPAFFSVESRIHILAMW
jgi:hypothetical protein